MTLREYIFLNRIRLVDFAEKLGISVGWLSKIQNEKDQPHKSLKLLIEEYTDGKVKHDKDWRKL
jgi:transcriptional regulator with XRE-family HTH domain